mgnify:CR=1 FL=1|jgi:hypothetical protein
MNTNAKHYEELNIQPWEIMERNFTTEEFVAYLKGNIIKYTLRDKGQALSDAEKIKHYAEKLIEVQKGRPVLVAEKPEEVAEAPLVESEKTYTYNIGDRVLVKPKIERTRMKGTVIRTPVDDEEVCCNDNYVIELDSAYNGWKATLDHELVRSDNAGYADDEELEPLTEEENESEESYKFKVGDRVKVIKHNETGTIIRLPKKGLRDVDRDNYIVELDEEYAGWIANIKNQAVESDNAWYADDKELELLKEEPKKTLEPNKWYNAEDFTVEELKELLPVGTTVTVTREHDNDRKVKLEDERLLSTTVNNIGKRWLTDDVRVGITGDCYWRRYFKITEE